MIPTISRSKLMLTAVMAITVLFTTATPVLAAAGGGGGSGAPSSKPVSDWLIDNIATPLYGCIAAGIAVMLFARQEMIKLVMFVVLALIVGFILTSPDTLKDWGKSIGDLVGSGSGSGGGGSGRGRP